MGNSLARSHLPKRSAISPKAVLATQTWAGSMAWCPIADITQLQFAPLPASSNQMPPVTPHPAAQAMPAYPGAVLGTPQSPYTAPQSNLAFAQPMGGPTEFAGFWRRAAAYAVDSIIVFVLLYVLMIVLALFLGFGIASFGTNRVGDSASTAVGLFFLVMPVLAMAGYYALWNASRFMASPGKMAMGLIVVNAQAQRLHFLQACVREFIKIIGTWLLLITFTAQPLSAYRQTLHDMASASVVLRTSADAGMPSVVVWILNACTVSVLTLLIAVFLFAGH
jgi:uncharacterized RDD family membrane protein YckC